MVLAATEVTLAQCHLVPHHRALWWPLHCMAAEALVGVDVAIISLPQSAVARLSGDVLVALCNVPIVVETGNSYPGRGGRIDAIRGRAHGH